jgi:hypothetical protein
VISKKLDELINFRVTPISYSASHGVLIIEFTLEGARFEMACAMCTNLKFKWKWISIGPTIQWNENNLYVTEVELDVNCEEVILWQLKLSKDGKKFEKNKIFQAQNPKPTGCRDLSSGYSA